MVRCLRPKANATTAYPGTPVQAQARSPGGASRGLALGNLKCQRCWTNGNQPSSGPSWSATSRTAQPVSSAYVAQLGDLGVSPATVRNEMAVLEQEGYLFQPHASAGRVPTDKGYRFFVDSLPARAALTPAQSELVRMFFARTHGELERMLAETSGLLSKLTDYAAVVVAPNAPEPGRVRSLQLVKVTSGIVLAVAVLGNTAVERRPLELSNEMSDAQVERASTSASAFLVGATLDKAGLLPSTGTPPSTPWRERPSRPSEKPSPRTRRAMSSSVARPEWRRPSKRWAPSGRSSGSSSSSTSWSPC